MLSTDAVISNPQEESEEEETWISQHVFCNHHQFFVEVPEEFIEDDFNMTGLSSLVPLYNEALEMILDLEPEFPEELPDELAIRRSAELLYGLVHARFIITRQGLNMMAKKYSTGQFGKCPRVMCEETYVIPQGQSDLPGFGAVKLFCPCCKDLYDPQTSRLHSLDGAFFGTSFAGIFIKAYKSCDAACALFLENQFQLTIYGFKISERSLSGPRMKWLRMQPPSKPADPAQIEAGSATQTANNGG